MKRLHFQKRPAADSSLWDPSSCMLKPRSKRRCSSFCTSVGAMGGNYGHLIKMPKSSLDLFASLALATMVGGHFWSSPPVVQGRFTRQFSLALELLQYGWRVLLRHRVFFMGEIGSQDASAVEGGGIGLFWEDQRSGEGGDWLSARGK